MTVLITSNHLFQLGGSETFTYTLAKECERRGFEVDVFTHNPSGVFSLRLNIVQKLRDSYDLILVSHNTCLPSVSLTEGPKIFTSHGVFPSLEQPIRGADHYVAISKEVADHLKKNGFDSTIIFNGVDCERFSPQKPIRDKLTRVLCLPQSERAMIVVKSACNIVGAEFCSAQEMWDVETLINEVDLVVTLGRGAYESMACGRAVVVFDYRWYIGKPLGDGIVTPDNDAEMSECNFSGRRYKREFNAESLAEEFRKYDPEMGPDNREIALERYNVEKQLDRYLELVGKL